MKTIKINSQTIQFTAAEERALRYLRADKWVSGVDTFEEGPRKWRKYILPTGARAELLGVNQPLSPAGKVRVEKYFAANPRRSRCATGDPRRIAAILKQV